MAAIMNRASYLESDTLKVEHVFTIGFNEKWEKPIRRSVQSLLDISFHFAESFRFIAIGISAYFVLLGASKLLEAGSSKSSGSSSKSRSSHESSSHKSKSSTKDKSKDKSSSSKSSPITTSSSSDDKDSENNKTEGTSGEDSAK